MPGIIGGWVIVWIALILLLAVVEIFTLDFIFLMLAAGAAGGLLAALLGLPWWAAILVAAAVSLLLLAVVRPRLLQMLGRNADPHRTNVDALIGLSGTVVVAFTPDAPGQVRLANGETWTARILTDPAPAAGVPRTPPLGTPVRTPPLGTPVVVTAIDGSTAVVRLAERITA